jgi:hypothetical protein
MIVLRRCHVLRIAYALPVVLTVVVLDACARRPEDANGPSRVTPTIRVIGLDKAGVTLVTAASADFEAQVRKEAGKWAGAALLSSPQLVIVRNESPYTIVGYAVSFKSIRPDGKWDFHHIEFKYPDAVVTTDPDIASMLRDREIRPSEQRLVSRYFEIDPGLDNSWLPQMVDWQTKDLGGFARAEEFAELEIAIDAVLFEDGRLLGPNKSQVDTRFLLLLQRKQELYRAATELMASGNSLDAALAKLKAAIPAAVEMEEMLNVHLAGVAFGDALRLRARYGADGAADAIRRAVRQSPFTIRKVATP